MLPSEDPNECGCGNTECGRCFPWANANKKVLSPYDEKDRLEIASQLYERFCSDLVQQSDKARVRLISGIQVALRDAAAGDDTPAPFPKA